MTKVRAPRFSTWLLRRCLPPGPRGDSIVGDLYEEYVQLPAGVGRWFWYSRQAILLSVQLGLRRSRHEVDRPNADWRRRLLIRGPDLRHLFRRWRRRPGYTLLAAATLGIGIGATTAIVTVVDRVLLRGLPYPDAHELVTVDNTFPAWRGHEVLDRLWDHVNLSYPEYRDLRDGQRAFQAVAIYSSGRGTLTDVGDPTVIEFGAASSTLFPMLGAAPVMGRTFSPDEEGANGARVAVVSHGFWVSRMGSDANVVGRVIAVDGERYTIIGVLPPEFRLRILTTGATDTEVWVPAGIFGDAHDRGSHQYEAIARLRPGISLEQAAADAGPLLRGNDDPARMGVRIESRQGDEVASSRSALLLLLASASLLMLIAGVNVATLFTAEGTSRRHELATRGALGASRTRLVAQLLLEAASIGLLGAAIGVGIALLGVRALLSLAPPDLVLPESVPLDVRVLLWAGIAGSLVGCVFGVGPAVGVTRDDHGAVFSSRTTAGHRHTARMQGWMIGLESALSVVLLVVSGLLARSLFATLAVDPGFRGDNLVAVDLPLSGPRTQDAEVIVFARELVARIGGLAGVTAVTGANVLPFVARGGSSSFEIVGQARPPGSKMPEANRRAVLPGFHEVLGIPVLAGRTISSEDIEGGRPVVVVSEAMAARYWPGTSPIGSIIARDNRRWEVVGVVGDVLQYDLTAEPVSTFYFSFFQQPPTRFWLLVQSNLKPSALLPSVRAAIADLAPEVAVGHVDRLDEFVTASTGAARYRAVLVSVFGVCSLLLAAAGMFGVTARAVVARRRELGIRLALGAHGSQVMRSVVTREMRVVALGTLVGLVLAGVVVRAVGTFVFGISPWDMPAFAIGALSLVTVGLLASWLPARRTASLHPAEALQVD